MSETVPSLYGSEPVQSDHSDLFEYTKCLARINKIIAFWGTEFTDAELRRKERDIDLDIELLRQRGDIEDADTFIPDRVIASNIQKDCAEAMTFLNSGYRLGIFECTSNPEIDSRQLEIEVTKGLTYEGWYREFFRTVDGASLHKCDYLEVVFDPTKPLHVGFEHVGYDKLLYNRRVNDIQDSELLLRKYEITIWRLEQFTQQGFDPTQIQKITEAKKMERDGTITIYKVYFKCENIVYVGWMTKESGVSDWLKQPEPLRLGIYEKDQAGNWTESNVDIYPIFTYLYSDNEWEILIEHKGRGFLDQPQQEANTVIITSFVNRLIKSGWIFGSPKTDDGESAEMKQLDVELTNGGIYAKPLDFWSMPEPSVDILRSLQYLDSKNAAQRGETSFAVTNRQDSRKTAKELDIASQQQTKITSLSLATFSEFVRSVLNFSWKIIQSQALQEKITLLLKQTEIPGVMGSQVAYKNDFTTISQAFDIRAAGDTDVIEAQQEQQKMQQDWPVIQTTPLAPTFLQDFVKLRYPKKADQYIKVLQAGQDQGKALVTSLSTILQGIFKDHPEDLNQIAPAERQQLQQIQQQVNQYLGMPV